LKTIFFILLSTFSYFGYASDSWKVVAETTSCQTEYKILAKSGEKFVILFNGEKKVRLHSEDGSSYIDENPRRTIFSNKNLNVSYVSPSVVDGNLPKLKFAERDSIPNCQLNLK
jgi:hypothetical protein